MELSRNYIPAEVEEKWTRHWKEKGYFKSVPDQRKAFTIVIPPPNVTGVLHMGHTLNETVQDILIRHARMNGYNTCWVPGSDHASIATEAKVVAMLKEKGIDKNKLSREEFLKYAFEWKEKYGNIIYHQIEKLGCSVDWDRVSFTMDKDYHHAVIKVFVDLYNKGLIYRGARMINWDPSAKTALSDEEVEYKEVTGVLYYIKYYVTNKVDSWQLADDREEEEKVGSWQLADDSKEEKGADSWQLTDDSKEEKGKGQKLTDNSQLTTDNRQLSTDNSQPTDNFIIIATQRPETIMGDTAVCANPGDERYMHLKGRSVLIPLINKEVPVIYDEYVDKEFGTGILKITPAHDINDYNIGLKHGLPIIDTLNDDGTISEAAQIYVGEDRFAARKKIVEELKEKGLLVKEEEYQTRLGYSQRTNVVAEPKISTQWFLKMKELAAPALQAVTDGAINIHPGEKFLATYKYWLENVKDWCISRQLWWGQQIPAWYDEEGRIVVAESKEAAEEIFKNQYSTSNIQLKQDEDVLDTWFSSWLWPIEVFKGITQPGNKEINYYYPTSVLVTGQDIIFFWVARMIMAGMEYMKEKPFSDVYFTGMVRDKQGRKMSKSLGNSPDLLELVEKYGADAVRFGIMISSPAGNDLLFDESSLEQGRNFNNKIWNALKLVKMWEVRRELNTSQLRTTNYELRTTNYELRTTTNEQRPTDFALEWFANRLNEVKIEVEILYQQFRLSEALKTIYSLIWDDFCSWYLEWVKPGFEQPVPEETYLSTVHFFEELLQLLHPFMPFVTEEIYHQLGDHQDDLTIKQFTAPGGINKTISDRGNILKTVITAIRDVRNKNQIKPKEKIRLHIQTQENGTFELVEKILSRQINAESISYTTVAVENSIAFVAGKDKFYIEANQQIDTKAQKELLLKDLEHLKGFLNSVEKKLGNERFVKNADPAIIALERKKKEDAETKIKVVEESLASIS